MRRSAARTCAAPFALLDPPPLFLAASATSRGDAALLRASLPKLVARLPPTSLACLGSLHAVLRLTTGSVPPSSPTARAGAVVAGKLPDAVAVSGSWASACAALGPALLRLDASTASESELVAASSVSRALLEAWPAVRAAAAWSVSPARIAAAAAEEAVAAAAAAAAEAAALEAARVEAARAAAAAEAARLAEAASAAGLFRSSAAGPSPPCWPTTRGWRLASWPCWRTRPRRGRDASRIRLIRLIVRMIR